MTPDFLPLVFERFRQADSSKTREHGGLGLGLSLAHSFARAHGGSVIAESPGLEQGSRFTVRLPRLHTPVEDQSAAGEKGERAARGLHVLIVEDSPDTLEMLHKALKARGYETTLCDSAAEALSVASTETFDLLISDIGMPEIDGYELIRRVRQLAHLSNVPAIALSGYATEGDIKDALAAGFDAHVAKPVEPSQLAAEMERVLQSKQDKSMTD
jgi:CheY-like chemotaxis protein